MSDPDKPVFEIRKGEPLPPSKGAKYPWADMEVGDSFVIPSDNPRKTLGTISSSFANQKQRYNRRFAARLLPEGVSVWRIA